MDPTQPKQEPAETTNLNSVPLANNTTGSENPENAEANTAVNKKPENAINKNINETNAFTVEEAIAFTERLRRGENDPTKATDPIILAEENFVDLARNLHADLANLSIDDRASREVEVFNAQKDYDEKLAERKKFNKQKRLDDLQKRFAEDEDDSASFSAIAKGKVLAKLTVRRTECAMVELKTLEGGECYQVFDASLVDQEQLREAPHYDALNLKKISPGQAALAFAAAYQGGPDTLLSTFVVEDFLAPKLPKQSAPHVVPRKARTTIWIMGHLKEGPEKGPDGKLIRSGLWMMPRSKWEGMKPSKNKRKIYEWGVGRAIRQFHNYQDSLEAEKKESKFEPETTPDLFNRNGSESAEDWQVPTTTPEPQGTPERDLSETPTRFSSVVTERATPAPVFGGGDTPDDLDMDILALDAKGQGKDELSVRIEQQRAKIRALELAAEERRRANQPRIQERAREAESIRRQRLRVAVSTEDGLILNRRREEHRREDRLDQEETNLQSLLDHKASVADDTEDVFREGPALAGLQEEQLREDKLERDGLAMQALFHQKAVERRLARIREKEQGKEERRLVKIREKEARDLVKTRQREARDRASREQGQLLARQQDDQRRREREARDQSCLRALERHEAAVKAEGARKAEERRLAKLREAEQKQALRYQKDQQRRMEQQRRDEEDAQELLRRRAITEARKARVAEDHRLFEEHRLTREAERERKQLLRDQKDQQHRLERQARDEACMQALIRHEATTKAKKAQEAEERRLGRLIERERLPKEQGQASHDRRHRLHFENGLGQDELLSNPESSAKRGRPRLTKVAVDERDGKRAIQDEQRREDKKRRDEAGRRAIQRHKTALDAQKAQRKSLTDGCIVAFDGVLSSFLDEEFQYMKQASADFPEGITSDTQMTCMRDYQRAISDASRRLPCGICGGLFQEDDMVSIDLQAGDLRYFLQRTKTAPDCCAVKDDIVSLCTTCNSTIVKRAIPPLSAGNFVNCLFCQDYPEALKKLNTVEEAFIARAHVIGIFLKLTSGAKGGISYRGSRGHSVAVRQDPSELLKILPAARLQDHTTITVSWDRGTPPSEENLARFCSVDKAKVVNSLLWLCANNPGYKLVVVDYSVLDSWPDHHIPQEIKDAFITLGSEPGSTDTPVEDEREGYATSLQDGLFENELDAEVEDAEPGSILSRSFFSDLHGQDLHSTPATLATLQAILQEQDPDRSELVGDDAVDVRDDEESAPNNSSRLPHISYTTTQHLPAMSAFTDPDYFTAAFPTLFPFGIGGHLGDANGDRPEEVSLKAFARYTMLHHSLLWVSTLPIRLTRTSRSSCEIELDPTISILPMVFWIILSKGSKAKLSLYGLNGPCHHRCYNLQSCNYVPFELAAGPRRDHMCVRNL
ncbi:hypothetical protein ACLOAV_004548 [Pseudogymnoascus australis]